MEQIKEDYLKMEARRNEALVLYETEREYNKSLMNIIRVLRVEKESLIESLMNLQNKYGVGANQEIKELIDDKRTDPC
jgi:16S rRNA C1402 (ribose-2'-O) methylase RsmI|tara:strand:- start:519 stop:752 length:234 start_codon:yes stop_codon:yes gene_type:complete